MQDIFRTCVLIFFLMGPMAKSQPEESTRERRFDPEKLEQLKNDKDLKYEFVPEGVSLWKRFLFWLRQLILRIIHEATTTDWTRVLILGLFIIALLYIVMRVLRIDTVKIFYRNSALAAPSAQIEDIHAVDLNALLNEALLKQDYRLAIRLQFLQVLKLLSERGLIRWEPGKTTHEYLTELNSVELRSDLNRINRYFEYTWYGNFAATPELYQKVSSTYQHWKTRLS